MEKYIYNEKNGLWYELQDDYYLPCLKLPEDETAHTTAWSRIVATVSDWIDSSQFRSAHSAFSGAAVSICRALLLPFPLLQRNYLSLQQKNLFIEPIVPLFEFLHRVQISASLPQPTPG